MITSGNSFVVSRQVYFQFFIKMLYQRILSRYKLWNATNVEVLKYGSRVDREGVGAGVSGDRGSPTKSSPAQGSLPVLLTHPGFYSYQSGAIVYETPGGGRAIISSLSEGPDQLPARGHTEG